MDVSVTMRFLRETPGTYVYQEEKQGGPIRTLYINKSAFNGKPADRVMIKAASISIIDESNS